MCSKKANPPLTYWPILAEYVSYSVQLIYRYMRQGIWIEVNAILVARESERERGGGGGGAVREKGMSVN